MSVGQTPKTPGPALKNSHHPLQNSHATIATRSLDTTYEVDSSTWTSLGPNSTPRQQLMQRPAPTKSVPHHISHYTPPQQTQFPMQATPSSNIAQQPNGLTSASTTTPRTTRPLRPQPSNHFPPSMISPEHNPPKKGNLKAWWNQFTLVKFPKGDPFNGPYRGPFIFSSSSHKLTPRAQRLTQLIILSSGNLSKRVYAAQVSE